MPLLSRKKPLFSRRGLIALTWILPITILLLQLSGRQDPPQLSIGWNASQQLYFLDREGSNYRLDLILPQRPALSDNDWQTQALARAQLKARLSAPALERWLKQQGWQLTASNAGGYQVLQFEMSSPPTATAQEQLLALLNKPSPETAKALLPELNARRYLALQDPQTRLLAAFGEQLPAPPQISPAPRWSLIGPDLKLTQDLAPSAEPHPPSAWQPGQRAIPPASAHTDTGWILVGEPLLAPHDGTSLAQQRFVAEAVARLLPQLASDQADYRWRWQPLIHGGYRVLLVHNWPPDSIPTGHTLAAALNESLLQSLRTELLARFDQLLQTAPQQWLDLVALYRLPLDSDAAFRDTLQQLTLTEARTLLTQILGPEHRLTIRLTTTEP